MFFSFLYLASIYWVISLSNEEDLSISKYSQIGCLILQSDKQYLVDHIQENFLLPYQTFSSPSMTIELCFRFCRRWFILISNHQTNCICLYTINNPYQFNQYLGEYISKENCTSKDLQIYSLTEDIYVLPSLSLSPSDDWSFDGCYSINGIQTVRVNLALNTVDYPQALNLCRKHCQSIRGTDHYSYYLSRKKSCYCSPLRLSQRVKTIALRKPLVHCSFLSYICQAFSKSCERLSSETNLDTLIKIDVQHHCLSTEFLSFIFDRMFYLCLQTIILQHPMTFSTINYDQKCLSVVIRTIHEWTYLIQSSWITYSKLYVAIDRNSTYIYQDLFRMNNLTFYSNNLCIALHRTDTNIISYELIQCTEVQEPGYVLCAQKPLQPEIAYEEEFQNIDHGPLILTDAILSCPPEFILFNQICYYIHTSFIYNIRSAERVCYNQYFNSTLVKFDSHDWGNINATRFLGRTLDDILLELFYYFLEKTLLNETINESNRKHWLRLLLGDKNDPRECILRYFVRSTGAFTSFYRCNNGGHPVCQSEPIRTKISSAINETVANKNTSMIEMKTESTTPIIVFNLTDSPTTSISICENCTSNPLADEDLVITEMSINSNSSQNNISMETIDEPLKKNFSAYRPLIVILTGPVLALLLLLIGIGLLIRHLREYHGPHSARNSVPFDFHRTKRSSTTLTINDIPNTPAVLYTRLKQPRLSLTETDILIPIDNSLTTTDDIIQILPPSKIPVVNVDNQIKEDEEELLYPIEK